MTLRLTGSLGFMGKMILQAMPLTTGFTYLSSADSDSRITARYGCTLGFAYLIHDNSAVGRRKKMKRIIGLMRDFSLYFAVRKVSL